MRDAYTYSIHDIMTVDSEERLPELAEFRTRQAVDLPSVRVRIGGGTDRSQRDASPLSGASHIRYDEDLGPLGFAAEITVGDAIEVQISLLLKMKNSQFFVQRLLHMGHVLTGCAVVWRMAFAQKQRLGYGHAGGDGIYPTQALLYPHRTPFHWIRMSESN